MKYYLGNMEALGNHTSYLFLALCMDNSNIRNLLIHSALWIKCNVHLSAVYQINAIILIISNHINHINESLSYDMICSITNPINEKHVLVLGDYRPPMCLWHNPFHCTKWKLLAHECILQQSFRSSWNDHGTLAGGWQCIAGWFHPCDRVPLELPAQMKWPNPHQATRRFPCPAGSLPAAKNQCHRPVRWRFAASYFMWKEHFPQNQSNLQTRGLGDCKFADCLPVIWFMIYHISIISHRPNHLIYLD